MLENLEPVRGSNATMPTDGVSAPSHEAWVPVRYERSHLSRMAELSEPSTTQPAAPEAARHARNAVQFRHIISVSLVARTNISRPTTHGRARGLDTEGVELRGLPEDDGPQDRCRDRHRARYSRSGDERLAVLADGRERYRVTARGDVELG